MLENRRCSFVVVALVSCGGDTVAPSPLGPLIVVEPTPAGAHQLGSLHADGTRGGALGREVEVIVSPRWSPSGSKIAYVAHAPSESNERSIELVVLDADGQPGPPRELLRWSTNEPLPLLHWLPADRGLVWTEMGEEFSSLRELELASGELRRHTDVRVWDLDVDAAGRLVGLGMVDEVESAVMVFDADRSKLVESAPELGSSPRWSPRGDAIALVLAEPPGLGVLALDGSSTRLTTGSEREFQWHPGANQLSFVRDGALWLVEVESGELLEVLDEGGAHVWSPDGTWLAMPADGQLTLLVSQTWSRQLVDVDTFALGLDIQP